MRGNNGRQIPRDRMGLPDLGALARSKRQEAAITGAPIQPVVVNLSIQLPAATERLGEQLKQVTGILQAMAAEGDQAMYAINQERLAAKMAGISGLEDAYKVLSDNPSLEAFTDAVKAVCRANGLEFPQPEEAQS